MQYCMKFILLVMERDKTVFRISISSCSNKFNTCHAMPLVNVKLIPQSNIMTVTLSVVRISDSTQVVEHVHQYRSDAQHFPPHNGRQIVVVIVLPIKVRSNNLRVLSASANPVTSQTSLKKKSCIEVRIAQIVAPITDFRVTKRTNIFSEQWRM